MDHQIVEKIFEAAMDGVGGIAVATVFFIDEHSDAETAVDGVVVEQVDASDRLFTKLVLNHESELMAGSQVGVGDQKLIDLKAGDRCTGFADPPYTAVVFPTINQLTVLGLCDTKRKVAFGDEHGIFFDCLISFYFYKNTLFDTIKNKKVH